MAGKIKKIIDKIVSERSKGSETIAATTRTKLILKGIKTSSFTDLSPDDPVVIAKLQEVAKEMGVQL
jgi:hypothetical protein